MQGIVPLAVIALVVIIVVAYRASRSKGSQNPASLAATPVVRQAGLDRWVDAGIISAAQADDINAFELARIPPVQPRRISPVMEALAYVGGVLLAVGAGILVGQYWEDLRTGGQLAILAVAAVVFGVIGLLVGESDPATWRLRGFLWALSTGAAAAFVGLFVFEVVDVSGEPVAFAAAATGMLTAGAYWMLRDRPLQHALTLGGIAVSIGVAIAWVGGQAGLIGLAIWLLGVTWVALAWRERIPPRVVGYVLGAVMSLVACSIVGDQLEWVAPLLGLATAIGWIAAAVVIGEGILLAAGVVGTFVFLPWTIGYFFGDTIGVAWVMMLSGALLLAVVAFVLRHRGGGGTGIHLRWGGHELGPARRA